MSAPPDTRTGPRRGRILAALALFLAACAGAPPAREPAAPGPGERPPGPAERPAAPAERPKATVRPGVPPPRFVRVLVEESRDAVTFESDALRVWDASGRLLGEERGPLTVSAQGAFVRWGSSTAASLDLGGSPELRWGAKRFAGRVRLTARGG